MELDEEGTTAAAVTVVDGYNYAEEDDGPQPFEMNVNRPFLFAITDKMTGLIAFIGMIAAPQHS